MSSYGPRRKLKSPTLLTKANGLKSIVWILPGKEYADKFTNLLEQEAGVEAISKPVDFRDFAVSADYPAEKANHVIFVCWLLNEFFKTCQKLEKLLEQDITNDTE